MGNLRQSIPKTDLETTSSQKRIQCLTSRCGKTDIWEQEAEELSEWQANRDARNAHEDVPKITPTLHGYQKWGTQINEEFASRINRNKGRPMDTDMQINFESSSHQYLGGIRVHDNAEAMDLACSVGARAFASASDIFTTSNDRSLHYSPFIISIPWP